MFADRVQRLLESEARQVFAAALAQAPGPKALLVDDTLYDARLSVARPLDLFTDATFLREHGIRSIAPLSAHASRPLTDSFSHPTIVVIIRGINAAAARQAVTAIRLARKRTSPKSPDSPSPDDDTIKTSKPTESSAADSNVNCLVLTTPRRSLIVEKILRTAGLSDVPVALPLGFLPFDADLVTLDWPDAYRQIVLDGDNSAILASASALYSLAYAFNLDYATIRTAGAAATAVAEELLHTHGQTYPRRSSTPSQSSTPQSSVSTTPRTSDLDFIVRSDAFAEGDDDASGKFSELTLANVVGKGRNSHPVKLIIIDRGVDLVSPMLTQWTYEGLLDEAVGLHNNVMDLPVSSIVSEDAMGILDAAPNASGTVRKRLRGDVDKIFAQLRDLNYWTAVRRIGSVASSVREYYERRPTRETSEISQVKDYVKGLREVKSEHLSAAAHTAIASEISARTFDSYQFKRKFELEREMIEGSTVTGRRVFITDAIARGESLSQVVRLCCLWSVTSGGIDAEELDFVKREMLANFGLGVLPLLANLERAGMLVRCSRESTGSGLGWIPIPRLGAQNASGTNKKSSNGGRNSDDGSGSRVRATDYSWQFARAAMRLMTDFDAENEVTVGTAAAVASPYSGYTPLTVRLIETGLSPGGWANLPPVVTHTSLLPPGHATVEHRRGTHEDGSDRQKDDQIDAVILFVGGIIRAEASAVRMATRALGCRAVIATTAVLGPDEYVLGLSDRDSFGEA